MIPPLVVGRTTAGLVATTEPEVLGSRLARAVHVRSVDTLGEEEIPPPKQRETRTDSLVMGATGRDTSPSPCEIGLDTKHGTRETVRIRPSPPLRKAIPRVLIRRRTALKDEPHAEQSEILAAPTQRCLESSRLLPPAWQEKQGCPSSSPRLTIAVTRPPGMPLETPVTETDRTHRLDTEERTLCLHSASPMEEMV